MAYFITGGTGFIGGFFIEKLLQRSGDIYVLVRSGSEHKFAALQDRFDAQRDRLIAVTGDLSKPVLGLSDEQKQDLTGKVSEFFHFAAIYDMSASAESQQVANVEGTRHAVQCAEAIQARCFHHTSSIAAGGLYKGLFREDMFEECGDIDHPYFATKHHSEGLVRRECNIPFRIYRPGMVVGHSVTGEIDKVDGPYYFFKTLQKLRAVLPEWFPLIGIEGGKFNIVPVDYVVNSIDHIAHVNGRDGDCFHITNPTHYSLGQVLNIFCKAAHAPRFAMRIDSRMFAFIPSFVRDAISNLPPVRRIVKTMMADVGMPESILTFTNYPTKFDNREAEIALKGSGIEVPDLEEYAPAIWDYWERNLDPDLYADRSLAGNVKGKVVLVTGASSGIGLYSAERLASAGAIVLLVARTKEKLEETAAGIQAKGGTCHMYTCDVSNLEDCDRLIDEVLADHGHVDILLNNAGRSIRRSLELSYDRFHDFERTMQLNYFGCIRLIMKLAPSMLARRSGHIINMSSISVLTPSPRFSAYVASKSALDAWSRAAAVEFSDRNVRFTTINMPLVRTPMISATTIYDSMPVLSPDEAADMVMQAVIHKPKRIASNLGIFLQVMSSLAPRFSEVLMNMIFRMFSDSAAAKGEKKVEKVEASNEQVAVAALMKGIHF